MLKRREISNSRSSSVPNEMSLSGLSKIGSHTVRIADSISSTRVSGGHPAGLDVQHGDAPIVAVEHREEILGEVVLVARIERADDAEVDRRVARILPDRR